MQTISVHPVSIDGDTLHTLGCNDARCAARYRVELGEARFQCVRCERWVGYCMGCNDEMPALCDDCFCVIYHAPDAPTEAS